MQHIHFVTPKDGLKQTIGQGLWILNESEFWCFNNLGSMTAGIIGLPYVDEGCLFYCNVTEWVFWAKDLMVSSVTKQNFEIVLVIWRIPGKNHCNGCIFSDYTCNIARNWFYPSIYLPRFLWRMDDHILLLYSLTVLEYLCAISARAL